MTLYRLYLCLVLPGYYRVMRINARRVMERRAAGARR
jgi:hypothetical protein